jgi:diacylglycerol kinase family enzyme
MSTIAVVTNTKKITGQQIKQLRNALADAGCDDVEWAEAKRGSDVEKAVARVLKHGAETVVVCGGDGSVRAATAAMVDTTARLAVVPTGTANLFVSGLELPTEIDDIVAIVAHDGRRRIDTALCNGEAFNVMAGSGFDVRMLDGAEDSKERLGTLAYIRAGVQEARRRTLFTARVKIDGKHFFDGPASCVLIGNAGRLKGGIEAFPGATSTDGRLHVAVVTAVGFRGWARLLIATVLRRQQWSDQTQMGEGTSITVSFDHRRRFELDGGVKTRSKKLEFSIAPRSLLICAPANPATT